MEGKKNAGKGACICGLSRRRGNSGEGDKRESGVPSTSPCRFPIIHLDLDPAPCNWTKHLPDVTGMMMTLPM